MHFASDNWAAVAPEVADALSALARSGRAAAYGADEVTAEAEALIGAFFEREVAVFLAATGTATNALSLAALSGPASVVFCHAGAHVVLDEMHASGFFGNGLRLEPVPGSRGRMAPDALETLLADHPPAGLRRGRPAALTFANATEVGTAYTPADVKALAAVAKTRDLAVHMDGARFCNALVHLDVSPAELTWRAGVDVLSFGLTKLGAWCAEAIVAFDRRHADALLVRRKQAGQEFSKMRFPAAQFTALLKDGAWRRHAGHANRMAASLIDAAEATGRAAAAWPCQSNEAFLRMDRSLAERLIADGARFYRWDSPGITPAELPGPDEAIYRFVTDLGTRDEEISVFAERLARI